MANPLTELFTNLAKKASFEGKSLTIEHLPTGLFSVRADYKPLSIPGVTEELDFTEHMGEDMNNHGFDWASFTEPLDAGEE